MDWVLVLILLAVLACPAMMVFGMLKMRRKDRSTTAENADAPSPIVGER